MIWVDVLYALLGLPALVWTGYLFVLTLYSARRPPAPEKVPDTPRLRFDIVIPAHNEESMIGDTIAGVRRVDYPKDLYRILVVADNCTDATEERARQAGCDLVLRRTDNEKRGKGYALLHAFETIEREGRSDAVVVIDADTLVSPNILRAFARRMEGGARVLQAEYAVLNEGSSWRTQLMAIALSLFHTLRSLSRERLGFSCGLRGNGMAFSREVLRKVSYQAFSLVEDLEYGIALGEAGYRVAYVEDAWVKGHMAAQEQNARSQRRRWEEGRKALSRMHVLRLLRLGFARRDRVLLDLAMDLIVPPLSTVALVSLLGSALMPFLHSYLRHPWPWAALWALSLLFLAVYVLRGVVLSGSGARGLLALGYAPVYVAWKLFLTVSGRGKTHGQWVRTARDDNHTKKPRASSDR